MNENNKILKLMSGEEIVCKLVADENPRTFEIASPLKINTVPKVTTDGIEEAISLQRWIHFSEENIFFIDKSKVMVITQASYGLSKFYEYCVDKMNKESGDLGDEPIQPLDSELDEIEEEELWEQHRVSSKLLH